MIDALSTIMWPSIREERGLLASETGDVGPWTADSASGDSAQVGFEDDFAGDNDGMWYASLGSGDSPELEDFTDDEALPTRAEVAATHAEIFGASDVIGRLTEMRGEIQALEDESARRRAAARVALGFVYRL